VGQVAQAVAGEALLKYPAAQAVHTDAPALE
jgi:hypothetical protein